MRCTRCSVATYSAKIITWDFFITGIAGAGKSAVQGELRRLGYQAHDVDDPDVGAPYDNRTNTVVTMPPAKDRTPEWFATHSWRISRERLKALKNQSKNGPVFVCGSASNQQDMQDLFDKTIFLDIDEATLRARLARRTDNDFGKTPQELQMILARHRALRQNARHAHTAVIDATKPLGTVVALVLKAAGLN